LRAQRTLSNCLKCCRCLAAYSHNYSHTRQNKDNGNLVWMLFTSCVRPICESDNDELLRLTGADSILIARLACQVRRPFCTMRSTDAKNPTDIATDAEFLQTQWQPGGRVHKGFAEALEDILSALSTALAEFQLESSTRVTAWARRWPPCY